MDLINEKYNEYAEKHSSTESDVLKELNRETHAKVVRPRMLSGHLQGRALSMFSKMIQPRYILEIGTYTGYSAICMAEGLRNDGKLFSIDINEEFKSRILNYWEKAGIIQKAELIIGNAMDIIPEMDYPFELVFIDADKENYPNYYDLLIDKIPSGGYLIADNVLWSGKVLDTKTHADSETKALSEFNKKIISDNRVENVLLPIRDGLNIIRKL